MQFKFYKLYSLHISLVPSFHPLGEKGLVYMYIEGFFGLIGCNKSALGRVCNTHTCTCSSSDLSGFDCTAAVGVNMVSSYLKYSTTATKPCTCTLHCLPVVHLQCGFMTYILYHYTSVVLVQGVATTR